MKLLLRLAIFLIGMVACLPTLEAFSPSPATYGGTGRVLTSTYDSLNRLSTLTESGRATSYGYDLNGNTTKKTLPNNEVVTTTYDGMNRAQTILGKKPNGTLSYQYLNGYDRAGNVLWVDEYYNDIPIWRDIVMDYDNANRLLHEMVADQTGNTKTTAYSYDNAHNRTGSTVTNTSGAATVTSGFGFNTLNQLTSYTETGGSAARNVGYSYDFAGNRKTRTENSQTDTYGYDYEQRLVSLTKNTTGGTGTYAYAYDYRTRRVARTEGSTTTKLVFSGGTSVQEYTGTAIPANLTAEYVRGSDYGGGVGGVLYSLRATIPSYNHYNRRGDVTEKTNGAGATTYQASYQPFGLHPNDFGNTQDRQKANTKEEDPTGLKNEGQRYYELETAVFLTKDPAGFVDGPNLYTYVRQNPWTSFDPEGLAAELVIRKPEDYNRVKELKANGAKLYQGVKLVKGFDKDGNANGAWATAQRANGSVGADGHRYNEGKLAGTGGIWFFDNKEHAQAVKNNFYEYTWVAIGGQVGVTVLSAAGSGFSGLESNGGSASRIRSVTEEEIAVSLTPKSTISDRRSGHIFRDADGHLPDTSANRSLLQTVADDTSTTVGVDKWGNTWSAKTLNNGTQAWTQTRNGEIINGGINQVPRTFNAQTGLSSPQRPNNNAGN